MMTGDTPRQHTYTGPAIETPEEPSHAERVRTLLSQETTGTLSTQSRKHPGFPFGSLMPFSLGSRGEALFLISNMAMHTQNLRADPRASLFVSRSSAPGEETLGAARVTLVGEAVPVPAPENSQVREAYLLRHENSRYWVDFSDFHFFRLEPVDIYYVGGFGTMGWVEREAYTEAGPDPLAQAALGILSHMNQDHEDAMILLARSHRALEASEASMTGVDRLGFTLRLKTPAGIKGTRINFPQEVRTPEETRAALVAMIQRIRETRSDKGAAAQG